MRVSVLGSGSWGTALAILLARNGHEVSLLGRKEEEINTLNSFRENLHYLPGFAIPQSVSFGLLGESSDEADMWVVAVPAVAVREVSATIGADQPLVAVASKGLELGRSQFLTDVVKEQCLTATVGILSGPNLAVEIARGIPTVAMAGFRDTDAGDKVRDAFSCGSFRVTTTDDVVGVELAGALKNVLAIGAGMSDGLGFGDNTKGAFLSRGLLEIARLGLAMGGKMETFLGPAGVGDLIATAVSSLSRNYRLGRAIGEGHSLQDAVEHLGQVAEGVPTSEAVQLLAKRHEVEMPVFTAVEAVIRGWIDPRKAVGMLMERPR